MVGTTFFIEVNMKTANGFEGYGCFDLGDDRKFALQLFSTLGGRPPQGDEGVLQMDLVEKQRGLPVNVQVISCSLAELCGNVKIITTELFKRLNLDEMQP